MPQLLDEVEKGETIVITRHGRAIARLVPEDSQRRDQTLEAITEMEALRASLPKSGITIQDILDMRHEGHNY